MNLAKLDSYDYVILPGVIRIAIDGATDPDMVDILSEIHNSNGRIYVEGNYYLYLNDYGVHVGGGCSYMELKVVEVA